MLDPDQYKQTKPFKGVLLFLTSRDKYIDAAVEHGAWLQMQAEDLRAKYLEGKFIPASGETRVLETRRFESLQQQLLVSLGQVAGVALVSVLVGIWRNAIQLEMPIDVGRAAGFCGTALVGWAALFELGGPRLASWDGESLSEVIHPVIFQILFIPGVLGLLCSLVLS